MIQLTHLCFIDDLPIFCKVKVDSVMGIWSILSTFYQLSRLQLNARKNEIFVTRVTCEELNLIHSSIGFKVGQLLVRYLWHPSSYKKAFLDRLLAIVGEYQIQDHRTNQICSQFLFWKGNEDPAKGARVNWKRICSPTVECGLEMKDLKSWNKAFQLKCNIRILKLREEALVVLESYELNGRKVTISGI
ncbi:reverse transcriptase [Gossypium australe]|uniref:Reverse transcriptase n=1 Tax=Gossypium australe TaxID=47621 RepID=A0A5B6WWK2_9ROSI|nr:reverse transcriptase [Gossypium australe]